jgi:multiple sugar transport system substrate-binding protein
MKSILNIRPFQLILMVVFVLFAFVGLYLFTTFKGFGGGTSIGKVVVWGTLPSQALTQEIGAITTADKGFGSVTYVQKQATTFDVDLANAIASGNGPDLILISQEQLLTEESRVRLIPFSAIPQRTYLNTYLPEDNLYLTPDGTYGIPYVLDPLVLYYNKNILASAGVATPPRSWEAVTGLAAGLSHVNADNTISQSTIPFGTYNNIENARGILSLILLQSGSSITESSTAGIRSTLQARASSSVGVPPAQAAVNFYTQFADPSRTVYSWNSSESGAQESFTSGAAALYVGYASEQPFISNANPNLAYDMAAIPQPQTAANKVDYGLAYAFAIPKASSNAAGALAAAKALANPNYLGSAAHTLSMVPANRALLGSSPSDAYTPIFYPMGLIAQGWLSPGPGTTDTIFSRMISSVLSGQQKVQDALTSASQSLDAALSS